MLVLGFVVFYNTTIVGQALLAAVAAVVALALHQLADPSPLSWAVPWETVQLAMSAKVRANHCWLHGVQALARERLGPSARIDGFATREGFVLIGHGLDVAEVRWCCARSWRMLCGQSMDKKAVSGCKTTRSLLALCLVMGGLIALGVWGRLTVASALVVSVVGGASGHGLAGPAEKVLLSWVSESQIGHETRADEFEVKPFWVPSFLWLRGRRAFRIQPLPRI